MSGILEQLKFLIPQNIGLIDFVQIAILFFAIYYVVSAFKNTRGWILVKGLFVIGLAYLIVYATGMTVIRIIMQSLFSVVVIAVVLMFQPELQRIIEEFGKGTVTFKNVLSVFKKDKELDEYYSEETINQIVQATEEMAKVKTGALIVLERGIPLNEFIESGIPVDAVVTSALLINTFEKNTPLHDGSVIIKNERVAAATCYLPLTKSKGVKKSLGTRHRAGIGLSENTDAVSIVVSEETGKIAACYDGKIKEDLSRSGLYDFLLSKSKKNEKKKKTEEKKDNNFVMKAVALFAAIILWAIIINIEDPVTSKVINNIPVSIVNKDALTQAEKTYEVTAGNTVNVIVNGRTSTLSQIDFSSISATADFTEMSIVNAVPIRVALKNNKLNADVKIVSNDTMKLALEDLIQSEIPVTVKSIGKPANGFYLSKNTASVNSILVKGSKSLMNTLAKAEATVNVSGLKQSTTTTSTINLFDKNGEKINPELVEMETSEIEVTTEIFNTKTVEVEIELSDESKYTLEGYSATNVLIAGSDDVLERTNRILVTLDPSKIDVTKNEFVINLNLYLPSDVYLASENSATQTVNINIVER